MKDDDFIVSGFGCDAQDGPAFAVAFANAERLDRGGSTCDAYVCSVQRRRLFVKRLKAEYRANPLYLAAFDKEYDLGVSLSHPSLPRYVGFGGDYIAMDYIEGDTLADLINRGDPRLKSRKFVRRLLLELVDVVEYLHNRNVVHCDIKPDNIIISPHPDRPLTLVDFDKAYSSWLGTTHGNPNKYGCSDCADGQIDFKGIGSIADRLGVKRLAKACAKDGVTARSARSALRSAHRYLWWIIVAAMAVTAAVVFTLFPKRYGEPAQDIPETPVQPIQPPSETPVQPIQPPSEAPVQPVQLPSEVKPTIDTAWIASLIAEKTVGIEGHRQELMSILDCDTVASWAKQDSIMNYLLITSRARGAIIYGAVDHYRDLSQLDVQMAVRRHPEYLLLDKEESEMLQRIVDLYPTQ